MPRIGTLFAALALVAVVEAAAVVETAAAAEAAAAAGKKLEDGHIHQPAYGPSEDSNPRGHQQAPPYAAPPYQQPQQNQQPTLLPAPPVAYKGSKETAVGHASRFPAQLGLYPSVAQRKVVDTQVRCIKTRMQVVFKFSAPFSGYIYPYQHFTTCLLFRGRGDKEVAMDLKHGTCGDEENTIRIRDRSYLDPVIEHRLMIQWEKDIICEDDVSVIVRCDRPDDFNKTVEWNFETLHLRSTLERSQHPGPKMWMEIQKGEGPSAPPLSNELVYIGDVLTLVFTLTDNVYWFDSNILACFAVDGGEKKAQIEWDTSTNKEVTQQSRVYSGEMTVIESGCSVKPKIFSHFIKEKHTRPNGDLVTLHYAYFKAFRFPTSTKIVLQCHVQVCYKTCPEPPPCSESYHPRRNDESKRRRRREVEEAAQEGGHELDQVNMYRSVDVLSAEESGEKRVSVATQTELPEDCCPHPPMGTINTVMIVLLCVLLLLVLGLAFVIVQDRKAKRVSISQPK